MKAFAVILAVLVSATAALAEPRITSISPAVGFTFAPTRVVISGSELADQFTVCASDEPVRHDFPCPVSVFFGGASGRVISASSQFIVVMAPPQQAGVVDVRVQLGGTELTRVNAFHYQRHAQPEGNYVRYLVPAIHPLLEGANGSRWATEMVIHNGSGFDLTPHYPWPGIQFPQIGPTLAPHESFRPTFQTTSGNGAFFYIPAPLAAFTAFELRVRDISRDAEGWGTEVPVVRVDEQFAETVQLLDVPTDTRYRVTLRIYGHDAVARDVRVAVFPVPGGAEAVIPGDAIEERIVKLEEAPVFPTVYWPAYAELDPISDAVRASGARQVRIEVTFVFPVLADPPLVRPIWALASITNNDTQQVTTITPHVP